MIIAQKKRKENIAEYLLYMWQVEDLLRAYKLDIDRINETVIARYDATDEQKAQIKDWYEGLIKMMELENAKQSGHLQINKNVILRLTDLHIQLLHSDKFPEYTARFYSALPYIVELRAKSGEDKSGEIETCFRALYGTLMLKLQGKPISEGTAQAMREITMFVTLLTSLYHKNEEKPLFEDYDNN
ncbi:MAG: DUF4924 family protein [Muribaculaceae bacterium]|nr:DUF4924 family protein [Muribaculaceae bacterium]